MNEKLQMDADEDALIISDSLLEMMGHDYQSNKSLVPSTMCTLFYESPSVGIQGLLISYKKTKNTAKICIMIHEEYIGEVLSCPEFIRVAMSLNDHIVYECDFIDSWSEDYRKILRKDGHVELHVSLIERILTIAGANEKE